MRLVCEIERTCDYLSKAAAPRYKGNLASMFIKKQEESIFLSSLPLPLILCFFSVVFFIVFLIQLQCTHNHRGPLCVITDATLYINLATLFVLFFSPLHLSSNAHTHTFSTTHFCLFDVTVWVIALCQRHSICFPYLYVF